jgi:hypothetical protein
VPVPVRQELAVPVFGAEAVPLRQGGGLGGHIAGCQLRDRRQSVRDRCARSVVSDRQLHRQLVQRDSARRGQACAAASGAAAATAATAALAGRSQPAHPRRGAAPAITGALATGAIMAAIMASHSNPSAIRSHACCWPAACCALLRGRRAAPMGMRMRCWRREGAEGVLSSGALSELE